MKRLPRGLKPASFLAPGGTAENRALPQGSCENSDKSVKNMAVSEQDVLNALRSCYDPEIPVNIVDLGLIYNIALTAVSDGSETAKQDVTIDMTLTAQGCPEYVNISAQVKSRLEQLPGIRNAKVNVVWTPPWTPERLSADARKQLGIE